MDLPALPFDPWRPTKETLHLWAQVVGKVRLASAPPRNHWWHVTYGVSPRGLTTGAVRHRGGAFEVEFDLLGHGLEVRTERGDAERFALRDGLSVAEFHDRLFRALRGFGVEAAIRARPYDVPFSAVPFASDHAHASYDADAASRFGAVLRWTAGALEEFAGGWRGKTSPVHFFWHAFDLALTFFSGRPLKPVEGMNPVEREAYSHEVASFGFWPGDVQESAPAFYAYAMPRPDGLEAEPLEPRAARWDRETGQARLAYEDVRSARDPRAALASFFATSFRAAHRRARWNDVVPSAL